MNSPSAVVCREIFDENSQPSAEEISEYAQQLGIDPESESHLLSLAKDGLMQALPAPWKAYYDEKLQTHYYFNEETKVTQWEHPLDKVYRELVRKARDVSTHDDTCASVQELLTSEEITKHLEKMETKVDSGDEDLSMDNSEDHISDKKETQPSVFGTTRRLAPLIGRPPLAPLSKISDKKLSDLRVSSLRKNLDGTLSSKPNLTRTLTERDIPVNRILERPKLLKQQSEIIDLKMNVLTSPEEDNPPFSPLSVFKPDRGLSLTGMGNIFLKTKKTDLPSPDTEKSLPLDSMTKSDPPKGILREKLSDTFLKRSDSLIQGKSKHSMSTDEDKKSVRFKLEQAESTISPSSNSSSEQNEGQSSIVSATPVNPSSLLSSSILPSSTALPTSVLSPPVTLPSTPEMISSPPLHITSAKSRILSPLSNRPSIPPRPQIITEQILSSKEVSQKGSSSERDSIDSDGRDGRGTSPRRRVLRPPAADYIKPDLFQKNFLKISDLVRPGDIEPAPVTLEVPIEKDTRPRSPLIPQKNKISINLMESIDSETSVDSPDKEFENLDLNDLDDSKDDLVISKNSQSDMIDQKNLIPQRNFSVSEVEKYNQPTKPITEVVQVKSAKFNENQPSPQNVLPKSDILGKMQNTHSGSDESIILSHPKLSVSSKDDTISRNNSKSDAPEINLLSKSILKDKPSSQVNSTLNTVLKSPRFEVTLVPPTEVKPILSPLSSFSKPNFSIKSPMKSSDSISSISNKSPKLDAVMLSQNKSGANNNENVVVVYQFETTQDVEPVIPKYKSPLSSTDNLLRDTIQRAKAEERKKLELMLQKELEEMRVEWADKERKMRTDLIEELKQNEEKFKIEKEVRLFQQKERHRLEMDQILEEGQNNHDKMLKALSEDFTERLRRETDMAEKNHIEEMSRLREEYCKLLAEEQKRLQIENDRTLSEMRDQLATSLNTERAKLTEENRHVLESLREEHNTRISDLRHDYRAEVERLRAQHACHLEELRARLAGERARRGAADAHALADKYRCLKEKYARLKHDVKMSIERRNKRRELSMTTGSETEKSNSHKVAQSLERCKEQNETSVSVVIESDRAKLRTNNNLTIKCNDNETSISESNVKSSDNNNEDWRNRDKNLLSPETSQGSRAPPVKVQRRATVAFREPCGRKKDRDNGTTFTRLRLEEAATTDCQDSSDTATTADERPKEILNGHGRRRCFTRLKSASTSRLNYSPKRGEGWCSPLESLRQQLRKLDDLEDQFPDLACQPAYSLRYPFAELGAVSAADTPELEFVRHRALVEREGMRRARAALRRRRAALRETREDISPHRAPSEEREATELEVALHRARALLGEKEIRLKHIERALRRLAAPALQPPIAQEETTSDGSSHSSGHAADPAASGAVLRSLRALHADVRDIWLALDARRPATVSPETSSCNAASTSQPRHTVSAEATRPNDATAASVAERARGLRAWLQTAP